MLTHDSGNCLIQNGGGGHNSNSDDSDDDNHQPEGQNNHGVQIQEIVNEDQVDPEGNAGDMNVDIIPEHNGVEEVDLFEEAQLGSMFAAEMEMNEIYNPCPFFANATGDVPGREVLPSSPTTQSLDTMRDLYMVYVDPDEVSRNGQRKRRHEETGQEHKTARTKVFNQGEGSGTTSDVDDIRDAVGPIPPKVPPKVHYPTNIMVNHG